MKVFYKPSGFLLVGFMLIQLVNLLYSAELTFSGDITGVSTYVWRGIKQYNGVAYQSTALVTYKFLSGGVWYSSVNFGADTPLLETDPFIELSLPTGTLKSALGATIYSYDFSEFNTTADLEYELFVKIRSGIFGFNAFFTPAQASTDNDLNQSFYWIELSTSKSALKFIWEIIFGYGTYSSRFLANPKKKAVNHLVLSATKNISKTVTIRWNYSLATCSTMDNYLWFSGGISF